jgi:hypothetical protein
MIGGRKCYLKNISQAQGKGVWIQSPPLEKVPLYGN